MQVSGGVKCCWMDSSDAQRADFGRQLAAELEGRARSWFAAAVAAASGESVSENAVALWIAGTSEPTRSKVWAIEQVLELPPGTLSRCLGYLPVDAVEVVTPEQALLRDPSIPRAVRRALIAGVEASRRG